MVKISIIVPIYNVEKYLEECIKSLINQTLEQIEIILINDGSKDNSLYICQEYAKKDNRIQVINKKNSGVSDTRNIGIEHASGEFIMFVDSDDWLEKEACKIAYEEAKKEQADSVIFGYFRESSKGTRKRDIFKEDKIVFQGDELRKNILLPTLGPIKEKLKYPEKLDSLVPIFAKIYKTEIIQNNNIKYIDLNLLPSECLMFNFEYYRKSHKVVYLKKNLYHYRRNNFSSITKGYRANLFDKWIWWINYMKKNILTQEDKELENAFYNRICFSVIPLSGNAMKQDKFIKMYREIKNILENEDYKKAYKQLDFSYFKIHWKVYFYAAKYRFILIFLCISKIMRMMIERNKK